MAGEQSKLAAWAKFDQTQDPTDEPYFINGIAFGFAPEKARSPGKTGDLAFSYRGGVPAWRKFAPDDTSTDEDILTRRKAWWRQHPRIVRWWRLLEAAALRAVQDSGRVFSAGQHIDFCFRAPHLRMRLPSGRILTYPFATVMKNKFGGDTVTYKDASQGKWADCNHGRGAYAAIWAENATSAVARDLLTAAMLRLEAAGYTINLHVHDEICAEAPEGLGSAEEFRRIMIELPPIEAKVREGHRFIKIKPAKARAGVEIETKPETIKSVKETVLETVGAEHGDSDARHDVGNSERGPDPDLANGDAASDPLPWEDLAGVSVASRVPAANGAGADDPAPAGARLGAQPDLGLKSTPPPHAYRKGPYPQAPHGNSGPKRGAQLASWTYHAIDGSNYLRVDKHITADDERHYYQHRWDDQTQDWVYGVKGSYAERKVPYRLPELKAALKANPDLELQIAEGEKDADSLARLGYVVTTNPGGARNWTDDITAWLRVLGVRNAAIHEDNDEAGRESTQRLTRALADFVTLRVVQYADVPEGEDVTWWLENGHTPAELQARIAAAPAAGAVRLEIHDAATLLKEGLEPPRGWLMESQFCRTFLSGLVAPGATGKTALRILQAIALALGRNLTGQRVRRRVRVLLMSFEDDLIELRRRIRAACIYYRIHLDDLAGWLFVACPKGLKLAEARKGSFVKGALEPELRKAIEKHQPALVILDPFVKLHGLDENDNAAMDHVADTLTQLAHEYDLAIDCPAHTRKGALAAGDADMRRGASAQRDAGRLDRTLLPMSTDEAELFGIDAEERRLYLRLDSAKVNLLPPARTAEWFKLISVPLGNGTADDPEDEVQTMEPWTPPDIWDGLDDEVQNRILDDIEAGLENGQRYSSASRAPDRAAWQVVQEHVPDQTEKQCRDIIKTWESDGVIYAEDYDDPVQRETRKGLRVNPNKRPGATQQEDPAG